MQALNNILKLSQAGSDVVDCVLDPVNRLVK